MAAALFRVPVRFLARPAAVVGAGVIGALVSGTVVAGATAGTGVAVGRGGGAITAVLTVAVAAGADDAPLATNGDMMATTSSAASGWSIGSANGSALVQSAR